MKLGAILGQKTYPCKLHFAIKPNCKGPKRLCVKRFEDIQIENDLNIYYFVSMAPEMDSNTSPNGAGNFSECAEKTDNAIVATAPMRDVEKDMRIHI